MNPREDVLTRETTRGTRPIRLFCLVLAGVMAVLGVMACSQSPNRVHSPPADLTHPPQPHLEGSPHGLGITRSQVLDRLEPAGFDFEEGIYERVHPPLPQLRGLGHLGQHSFWVSADGHDNGITHFTLSTNWLRGSVPPLDQILSLVDMATPNWKEAIEWIQEKFLTLQEQYAKAERGAGFGDVGDGDEEIAYGNYIVSIHPYTLDSILPEQEKYDGFQVDIRSRYASCDDALAAKEWSPPGMVGGYWLWKVPTEPDPDGDDTVCEPWPYHTGASGIAGVSGAS